MKRGAAGKLIRRSTALRPSEKLIMLTLLERADNADSTLPYSPSLTRIKAETKLSHASVIDGLAHLELHGWLSREQRQPGQLAGTRGAGYGCGRVRYCLIPAEITPCSCPRARSARRLPDRSTNHVQTGQELTHLDRSTAMPVSAGQDATRTKGLSVTRGAVKGGALKACRECGSALDPVLSALGYVTHPMCDPADEGDPVLTGKTAA